jgi:hypothetical protein
MRLAIDNFPNAAGIAEPERAAGILANAADGVGDVGGRELEA